MTYRFASKEDFQAIDKLCAKHSIATPTNLVGTMIAVDETNEVRAILGMRVRLVVEPFISESHLAGVVLWEKMKTTAQGLNGVNEIMLLTTKEAHTEEAEKEGFVILNKNVTVMERQG